MDTDPAMDKSRSSSMSVRVNAVRVAKDPELSMMTPRLLRSHFKNFLLVRILVTGRWIRLSPATREIASVGVREIGLGGDDIRKGMTFGPASNLGISFGKTRYLALSEESVVPFLARMTRLRINRLPVFLGNAETEMDEVCDDAICLLHFGG